MNRSERLGGFKIAARRGPRSEEYSRGPIGLDALVAPPPSPARVAIFLPRSIGGEEKADAARVVSELLSNAPAEERPELWERQRWARCVVEVGE